MGVLEFPVEVYDAAAHQLRIDILGRGEVTEFSFVDGRAASVKFRDKEFIRVDR
jgi:hypothetical protein